MVRAWSKIWRPLRAHILCRLTTPLLKSWDRHCVRYTLQCDFVHYAVVVHYIIRSVHLPGSWATVPSIRRGKTITFCIFPFRCINTHTQKHTPIIFQHNQSFAEEYGCHVTLRGWYIQNLRQ